MFYDRIRHWKESLVGKLLLRFWISMVIFFALIGFIQYQTLKYFLYKTEEQSALEEITSLHAQSERWLQGKEQYPQTLLDLNQGVIVAYFSPSRQLQTLLARKEIKNKPQALKILTPQWKEGKKIPSRAIVQTASKERYILVLRPVIPTTSSNPLGYILVASPLTKADNILNQDFKIYLSSALAVLIFGGLAAAFLLRRPLFPLSRISEISGKIAEGEYRLRIPEEPAASEILQLRSTLNLMLNRIESALATEKKAKEEMARFIADASHELRTPLTSIRGFLEILLRSKEPAPQTLHEAHQTMLKETDRLIQLVEDLLTLNRLAQPSSPLNSPKVSTTIEEVLPDVFTLLESLKGNRTLNFEAKEGVSLPLEPGELKQILYNLIHNAIQHTPEEGGRIQVKVYSEASPLNTLILSVSDNGEGISSSDQPHLFERFYRGSRSRERKKGQGAGLGLAIVSDIVKLRKGIIEVKSQVGQGSDFRVLWKT